MVIRELLQKGIERLKDTNSTAPQLDAAVLLCHALGVDRLYLTVYAPMQVEPDVEVRYFRFLEQCAAGVPVAYLTGRREFMSLEFEVGPGVLVPRPDTETLCEWVIKKCEGKKLHILDACCGSGCIGLSLAYYLPQCSVTLADISQEALQMSRRNAGKLKLENRVNLKRINLLCEELTDSYDVIVSNPPYIESDVIALLEKGVREYEPRLALDGGRDGLDFYRRLAQICPAAMERGALLALEVGEGQAGEVRALLGEDFSGIETVCDLAGIQRVVAARKK